MQVHRRITGRITGGTAVRLAAVLATVTAGVAGTACGSDAGAEPTRETTLVLEAYEDGDAYGYRAVGPVDVRVGDRLTIEMRNAGALLHDMAVIHPDGSTLVTAAAVATGDVAAVTIDLDDAGIYRINCNVDNHLTEHGMQAPFEVKNADGSSTL